MTTYVRLERSVDHALSLMYSFRNPSDCDCTVRTAPTRLTDLDKEWAYSSDGQFSRVSKRD